MKKILLFIIALLPMMADAFTGEAAINGINYYIITKGQTAKVIKKKGGYVGNIVIPSTIKYEGVICEVTEIGNISFLNCSRLTSITIPTTVTRIGGAAFNGCVNLTSIIIPDNVKEIGSGAFANCSRLRKIKLSKGLSILNSSIFENCVSLTSIVIPDGVKHIDMFAFYGCKNLKKISIPESIERIDCGAFRRCGDLTEVYCHAVNPPEIGLSVVCYNRRILSPFSGSYIEYITLYVPNESISEYQSSHYWEKMNFKEIKAISNINPKLK